MFKARRALSWTKTTNRIAAEHTAACLSDCYDKKLEELLTKYKISLFKHWFIKLSLLTCWS